MVIPEWEGSESESESLAENPLSASLSVICNVTELWEEKGGGGRSVQNYF